MFGTIGAYRLKKLACENWSVSAIRFRVKIWSFLKQKNGIRFRKKKHQQIMA